MSRPVEPALRPPRHQQAIESMSAVETGPQEDATSDVQLERSTYEIIRQRLSTQATELQSRLALLNEARREVFGSIETKLLATDVVAEIQRALSPNLKLSR